MKVLAISDFHGKFPEKLRKLAKSDEVDLILALGDYTGLPEWRPIVIKQLQAGRKGKEVPSGEEIIGRKKYKLLLKKDFNAGLEILGELNSIGKPVLIIFGNGDWYHAFFNEVGKHYENYVKRMKNLKNINYGKTKVNGITFVGFGGYMDIESFFNKKEWGAEDDEQIKARLERHNRSKKILFKILRKTKGERIFLFHYPPKGVFDIIKGPKHNPMKGKSAGIKFFADAIKKYNPRLMFCGHMHEYQGAKMLGKSLVINPGPASEGKCAIVDSESLNVRFYK